MLVIMPDKSNWRKKHIQGSRPLSSRAGVDDAPLVEGTRGKQSSEKSIWRKTIHSNRPNTPANLGTTDDADEIWSENGSEKSTSRLRSGPKSRSTWLTGGLKNITTNSPPKETNEPEFSEQWIEQAPSAWVSPVDPLIVLQSVHSHICNAPSTPIPIQHNSGLLRLFEDYRKERSRQEHLEALVRRTMDIHRTSEDDWRTKEAQHLAEIRYLELLIAHGTTGMAGLMKARQESTTKRHRLKKTTSTNRLGSTDVLLSGEKLDRDVLLKTREGEFPYKPNTESSSLL